MIVVNHDSKDHTSEVLSKIKDKKLKIIDFNLPGGKSTAIIEGSKHADADIFLFLDD